MWRGGPFFANDDLTLKGEFVSDGVEQTPDAGTALCSIFKKGTTVAVVNGEAASISGTTVYYKYSDMEVGEYIAYLTAKFNLGADERTGEIPFVVKLKGGIW